MQQWNGTRSRRCLHQLSLTSEGELQSRRPQWRWLTEQLINDFLYLVPVTICLPDRLANPAVHFKTCPSVYAKALIQFTASNDWMYNLQSELWSGVIDSIVKVTLCFVLLFLSNCGVWLKKKKRDTVKEEKMGSHCVFILAGNCFSQRKWRWLGQR